MKSIIAILGDWMWPLIATLFIATITLFTLEKLKNADLRAELSQETAVIVTLEGNAKSAALAFSKQLDADKQAHDAILTKANDDAAIKVQSATTDAANAVIARDQLLARLRARLATASTSTSRSAAPANFPTTSFSTPTQAAGMYSELFGSVASYAGRYAEIAEDSLIRGEQCEASYPVK